MKKNIKPLEEKEIIEAVGEWFNDNYGPQLIITKDSYTDRGPDMEGILWNSRRFCVEAKGEAYKIFFQ
jgi:hypothetical protein